MELHQQQERRKNRIEELHGFIESNQPVPVNKILMYFSSVSSRTLREYLKILMTGGRISVDQYGKFIIKEKEVKSK